MVEWRIGWRARAEELLRGLGLELELDIANDPFFGRIGRLLAAQQREQELKWELLAPVAGDTPTAIASSNYHQDHFGHTYGLTTAAGEPAHTGCMAFGEERVTLALFAAHGLDVDALAGGGPGDAGARLMATTSRREVSLWGIDPAALHPARAAPAPGGPTWRPTATPTR